MTLPHPHRPRLQPTTFPAATVADAIEVLEHLGRRIEEAAADRAAVARPAFAAWEGATARRVEADHDAGQRAAAQLADDVRRHAAALRACADQAADLRHHRRVAHDRAMDAWRRAVAATAP